MPHVQFPIHHTFGPMVTEEQWKLAWRLQFQYRKWCRGAEREMLRTELSRCFGSAVSFFSSGREAMLALLRALQLQHGEEIILQAYTCTVVPNAIHAAQGTAVYVDIDGETLNLDPERVQRAITPRTRAIICQHTFGIPADTKRLRSICDKRGLLLIEDCAHVMPDPVSGGQLSPMGGVPSQDIGVHGDVLIMSFGRDKAISGVAGGAALTRHRTLAQKLGEVESQAEPLSLWTTLNLIAYPVRYHFAKRVWGMGVGKAYLRWAQLLGLLPPIVTKDEKKGHACLQLHHLPNACAAMALQQLQQLKKINDHRRSLGAFYIEQAKEHGWRYPSGIEGAVAPQKVPLSVPEPDALRMQLKREQIYLDDGWCGAVVNPRSCDQVAAGYAAGSCPVAEDVAQHILALPTHPTMTMEQAKYLVTALASYVK